MGLFKRKAEPKASPEELQRWHGRSGEIEDAGSLSWEVVLEALKTEPEPELDDDMEIQDLVMAPLGLAFDEEQRGTRSDSLRPSTSIYHGSRHGRPVLMNQGAQRTGQKGAEVVWVCAATPELSIRADDGRLVADGELPPPLAASLDQIAAQPKLWSDVHLVGGDEGVVLKRPIKTSMHPQAWIYDLWLAERVADVVGASALPEPDWSSSYLPYHLDQTHTW
jgi:hypothetical protein